MKANRLAGEKSPYLLQHQYNPVDWRPWGEEAFAEARRLGRPVFLSIGYSTCHWCHVMAHESFEDEAIAQLMNDNFINIKLDREERPDVDRLYMAFVQASTGSGGWPMSVWLTPDGKPFFGGTYFPPVDRYGRAGFPNVLLQLAKVWRDSPDRVEGEGTRVMAALSEVTETAPGAEFSAGDAPLHQAYESLYRSFDAKLGGFGQAPKFPRPTVFNFLLRYASRATHPTDERSRDMALDSLRHMAHGGLRDHLGGGFHRYSVDAFWHVPHFEKMLYDQAQLVVAYTEAWQLTHDEFFADIARETLDYVLRDMTHPSGGFYSAEDADSLLAHGSHEHAEGAFYVWTKPELIEALGPDDAELFSLHYGVEEIGNAPDGSDPQREFVGKNILIQRHALSATAQHVGLNADIIADSLARSRAKLLAIRAQRPRPHLDDKILAAWNGLMISAFARAATALDEPRYLEAARRAARFLQDHLTVDGALLRTWRGEPGTIAGFAEDHAFVIQALLDLYEADLDVAWLERAESLQKRQDSLFWDHANGGYFSSAAGDPLVPIRIKEDYDGAEPSANSVSALNLLRLSALTNDQAYDAQARKILTAAQPTLERVPTAVPQLLVALDWILSPHAQAVIAGAEDSAGVRQWLSHLHREFHPHRVTLLADTLSARNSALADMKPLDGKATLYLCENFACQAPQTLPPPA